METVICALCVYFTALKGGEWALKKIFDKKEK